MGQKDIAAIEDALKLKCRELDLVLAIDHIRDTAADMASMLTAIATSLADHFRADICLIALIEKDTGVVELKAVADRGGQNDLPQLIMSRLAEKAILLDRIAIWGKDALQPGATHLPATLHLAAAPIITDKDERLGAIVLGREGPAYDASDVTLFETAESMVDSAVIQGYVDHQLKRQIKELETIYHIDHIRDKHLPFDEMVNAVLEKVCKVIDAETGFTMLYDRSGKQLELRATTSSDLFQTAANRECVNRLANESLERSELVCYNELDDELRSLMCLPLILNDEIIGVLGMVNHRSKQGFSGDDRRLLGAIGSQMDTAIFESIEQGRLRQVLGRSVDPRVMERLLANPDVDFLKSERMVLSVLYADLRGSTQLAERTDPELLVGFINQYLGRMTEVILAHEGTLDKFVGDEVMALFGAPFPQDDHAFRAVCAGLAMQKAHQSVMEVWKGRGVDAAPIGIGIATGELIVGEMGCPQRTDFTVIGNAANLGARICSAAKAGEVLISPTTYGGIRDKVDASPMDNFEFKGVSGNIVVYRIDRVIEACRFNPLGFESSGPGKSGPGL